MEIHYNNEGTFKILQLTDLHLGAVPSNESDQKTYEGIEKVIKKETPDLLIFTGDILYSLEEHQASNPKESLKHFITFINQFEIPYAYTFGNHDAEEKVTRSELHAVFDKYAKFLINKKHIYTVKDRENYVIELHGSKTKEVKQVFYVIDSGDYSQTDYSYYAWVLFEQISWLKEKTAFYKRKDGVKNDLIFQHIPIPEYWLASQNILDGKFNEAKTTGSFSEINSEALDFQHAVFSPEINSGLFLEILLSNQIWGMFVGHDHDNSFDGIYKGIHLVYGQSSGYNTYGNEPKGARVIELKEFEQTVETYSVYYE